MFLHLLMLYLLFSRFQFSSLILTKNELSIALALSEELKIDCWIFVENEEDKNDLISDLKKSSYKNIFTTFMSFETLVESIFNNDLAYYNSLLLILKGVNIDEIKKLLETFQEVEQQYRMMNHYTWIAFVEDQRPIEKDNTQLTIPYDCEFIIVHPNDQTDYILTEVYEIENRTSFYDFGEWNPKSGLKIADISFYLRRQNLNQTEILVFFHDDYYEYEKESPVDREISEILLEISEVMNFQFDKAKDGEWEYRDLILSFANYLVPDDYSKNYSNYNDYSEFIYPMFKIKINWYVKYPETKLRSDFYLQPFEKTFWLAIIISTIFGSICVVFIQNFVPKSEERTLIDNAFLGLEYLCNQSGNDALFHFSLRIASFSQRLIYIIVISAFGAVITSYLSAIIPKMPFQDLKSFLGNEEYKFAVFTDHRLSFVMKYYFLLPSEYYLEYDYEEELFERICQEKLILADVGCKLQDKKITCDLYQMEKPLGEIWVTILVSTNNPIRRILNYNVLRFYENGLQIRRQRKLMKPFGKSTGEEDPFHPIEFEQMREVLSIPLAGAVLATIITICELIYQKLKWKGKSGHR